MDYSNLSQLVTDNFDLICYIINLEDDTLMFMNKAGREAFSSSAEDYSYKGKKCYNFFKGYHFHCDECMRQKNSFEEFNNYVNYTLVNNSILNNKEELFKREFNFKIGEKDYFLNSKIVDFNGKKVRLSLAFNISQYTKYVDELEDKLSLEKTLIHCIETLIEDVDIHKAIINLLSIVGEYYFSDRAYIFEVDNEKNQAVNTYEWSRSNELATIDTNPVMTVEDLKYILEKFADKGELFIEDIYKELEEGTPLYQLLHETNTSSLLLVPLYLRGKVVSFIGVDNPQRMTDDLTLLHSISIFVNDDMKKRKLLEELENLSYNDVLTGVYNRNKYLARLADLDLESLNSIGVVQADANSLKRFNELYGEKHGDEMIKRIAHTLSLFMPNEVYRVAGDEFVGLCLNIEQNEFDKLIKTIRNDYSLNNDFPFAIGGVWQGKDINISSALIQANDIMLAEKQKYYKNNVCKLTQKRSNPLEILMNEIENGDFTVYLQPKVCLSTKQVIGAEALVRKFDQNKKIISPDSFVPMYEHDGTIRYLDFFVLEEVCKILQRLIPLGKAIKIAVNFSRMTFMIYDLVEEIENICKKYAIDHKYITVEITESIDKMNFEFFAKKLKDLKEAGFEVSLDDFGSKYSNLLMLSMSAFTEVKIDKGLIDNIVTSEENRTIVKNIIRMIKDLGRASSLAEGIENIEQAKMLEEFGCPYGQGYFYYRPMTSEDFITFYTNTD